MATFHVVVMLVCVAFLIYGVLYKALYSHSAKVKRALREGQRVSVADFPDGADGKIEGRLRYADEPLEAPLSGRRCAYYYVEVKEHRGKNNWKVIIRDEDGSDFFVEDDSGKALVRMTDATVAVHQDEQLRSGVLDDPSPELVRYLQKHGESSEGLIFNRTLRYEEGVLEAGERVAVRGRGRWRDDPDPSRAGGDYRSRPKRLEIDSPPDGELYVSDQPELFK